MPSLVDEPSSFEEACQCDNSTEWIEAAEDEMQSLRENQTWELVDKPIEAKIIDCRWLFKIKYQSNGAIARFKAKLAAKGFNQSSGFDYNETFSPVARYTTLRILLSLCAKFDNEAYQMDVKNAFLNGKLEEEKTVQEKKVELIYCPTENMIADLLTKALPTVKFKYLCSHLGIIPANRGDVG